MCVFWEHGFYFITLRFHCSQMFILPAELFHRFVSFHEVLLGFSVTFRNIYFYI